MYTVFSHQAQGTSELAAGLTDAGLEMLAGVNIPGDSVETELRLWHVLRAELEHMLHRGKVVASHGADDLLQALQRATRRVANGKHSHDGVRAPHRERVDACLCEV